MHNDSVEDDLRALDEAYQRMKPREQGSGDYGDEPPDGKYQVKVDRVEVKNSKNGNLMLNWQLRILAGPCAGRCLFKRNMLQSDENLAWLKTDLATCRVVVDHLYELPKRLQDLLDVQLEITKKTNDGFENIYFNRKIDIDPSARLSTPYTPASIRKDAEIPF